MGRILLAFLISTILLAYPAYLALQYRKLPPIHDITTDPIDPPRFEALARLRSGEGANSAVYAGLYSAEQQRIAYPDIETVELEVPPQRAYEVTLALIAKRKWLVIDERPPQPPRRIGRIEAVARTPIMGFREDVSIRITPDGEESRVDIRSSSRYFESDLGSNAARVSKLIEDINSAVDNAKPAQKGRTASRSDPAATLPMRRSPSRCGARSCLSQTSSMKICRSSSMQVLARRQVAFAQAIGNAGALAVLSEYGRTTLLALTAAPGRRFSDASGFDAAPRRPRSAVEPGGAGRAPAAAVFLLPGQSCSIKTIEPHLPPPPPLPHHRGQRGNPEAQGRGVFVRIYGGGEAVRG